MGLEERNKNLQTQVEKLKKENLTLENEVRLMTQDPVYLEKIARAKFKKARENEIVYKVVRDDKV